jgi:hypothetical protein
VSAVAFLELPMLGCLALFEDGINRVNVRSGGNIDTD